VAKSSAGWQNGGIVVVGDAVMVAVAIGGETGDAGTQAHRIANARTIIPEDKKRK
jgi:hypothetical protein